MDELMIEGVGIGEKWGGLKIKKKQGKWDK